MKMLIPMNKCNLYVGGVSEDTGVADKIDDVIEKIRSLL
jgi:hypothetical protein